LQGTQFGRWRAGSRAVCHSRLRARVNYDTFARFGRGLAGGGAPCSWAPSHLLLGKAQRSSVNAASTSTTSWVIACWWCWCASHLTGESGNGSVRCGGDRLLPSSGRLLAGARLPSSRASPGVAPRGVAATGTSRDLCWCAPPTAAGESRRGSARCGGGRHPLCSGENAFAYLPSSRASPEWLRAERRRSTFVGALLPSSRASPKGSAWCGGGRQPPQSRVDLWRLWQRFWAKGQLKLF